MAIVGKKIVASGPDVRRVYEEAKRNGSRKKKVTLGRVSPQGRVIPI